MLSLAKTLGLCNRNRSASSFTSKSATSEITEHYHDFEKWCTISEQIFFSKISKSFCCLNEPYRTEIETTVNPSFSHTEKFDFHSKSKSNRNSIALEKKGGGVQSNANRVETSHVSMYHVPWLKWRHNTLTIVQMAKTSVQLSSQNIFVTPTTVAVSVTN